MSRTETAKIALERASAALTCIPRMEFMRLLSADV